MEPPPTVLSPLGRSIKIFSGAVHICVSITMTGRWTSSHSSLSGYVWNTRHSRGPSSFWTLDGKDIYKELLSTAYLCRNMFPPADSTTASRCARTKASIPVFFSQTNVNLCNAGKTRTIFEGPVSTCGQGSRRAQEEPIIATELTTTTTLPGTDVRHHTRLC